MQLHENDLETIPVGSLGLITLKGCEALGAKINDYIVDWRNERENEHKTTIAFSGYQRDNYIVKTSVPRFGSGEAKGVINESVRGYDLYLLVDVCNYSLTYSLCGEINHMSPDDHYQDLKRVIAACNGKARRINVIMPFLYEGRQHRRSGRESLDCAYALEELRDMGIDNFITFDAHDPRVQNSTPLNGFDNFTTPYQFIKSLLNSEDDMIVDKDHLLVISPDEGALDRAIYFASVLGVDTGMFYKRRDYSTIVNGKNPIVAHEYMGNDVAGKDVFIADDIISSGESMLDIAVELKKRKANKIYCYATYPIFTNGLESFNKAYADGIIDGVFGTNLTYRTPELLSSPWFYEVDCSKYIAYFIASLNHDKSISQVIDPHTKIEALLKKYGIK
mgnify:CR=1 FL=1